MEAEVIDKLSNQQLARLLKLDEKSSWEGIDTAQILRHQLAAPLLRDLAFIADLAPKISALQRQMAACGASPDQSFLDQLLASAPMPDLLHLIKRFARQVRDDAANPLQGIPATVLYYASIAAALLKCRQKITQVPDIQLKERFQWAGKQKGAESLAGLFAAASEALPPSSAA